MPLTNSQLKTKIDELNKFEEIKAALEAGRDNVIKQHARLQQQIANWKQHNDSAASNESDPIFPSEDLAEIIGYYDSFNQQLIEHTSTFKAFDETGAEVEEI